MNKNSYIILYKDIKSNHIVLKNKYRNIKSVN